MKILIIVPAYNESENIINVVEGTKKSEYGLGYISYK